MERVADDGQSMTPDSAESLVCKMASALADASGVDMIDMPPLYKYIDLDALTQLFQPPAAARQCSVRYVTFTVEMYRVEVWGDGSVEVSVMDDQQSTATED
jgi:hypothetical protein